MELYMSMVVVPFGQARRIVQAANEAGAKGATVLHARGVHKPKKERLFPLSIEPEQEIVLIVASKDVTGVLGERISHVDVARSGGAALYILPVKGLKQYTD